MVYWFKHMEDRKHYKEIEKPKEMVQLARPQKDGLEYFPLDVDIDQDDKIALIEAEHGLVGFAIVIKLLMKIYKNSYFYEWTEKEQLLFSKRINVDINSINVIINDCLKWEVFNKNLFDTYKILTSKGIQKRFIEASKRRQKLEIEKKYLLLDLEEVKAYKNIVLVGINVTETEVNVNINPQRKEKEKVKESKEKEENVNVSETETLSHDNEAIDLIKYYETLKPGQFISAELDTLKIWLEKYKFDWVKEAIQMSVSNKGKFIKPWIEKVLENWTREGKAPPVVKKVDSFNNYDQRTYDYNDLEKKLLGKIPIDSEPDEDAKDAQELNRRNKERLENARRAREIGQ